MTTRKLCNLIFLVTIMMVLSCKKWTFNNKLAGTYVGTLEGTSEKDGVVASILSAEEISVGDFNNKDKTFVMTFSYGGTYVLKYRKSNVYWEGDSRFHVSSDMKVSFKPEDDSLTIESSGWMTPNSTTKTIFRGKKK